MHVIVDVVLEESLDLVLRYYQLKLYLCHCELLVQIVLLFLGSSVQTVSKTFDNNCCFIFLRFKRLSFCQLLNQRQIMYRCLLSS